MEFLLFAGIGSLAIIAAVAMLISDNAVYSALFLIVNFLCVAFLYLMLEAPFLAMVQIAVYAGAIMVLFLFVIMLLGAEKTASKGNRSFRWLPGIAMGLALAFVFSVGAAISSGNVDGQEPPPQDAFVRFVHAAPVRADIPEGASEAQLAIAERRFDVLVNGTLAVSGLEFNDQRGVNERYLRLSPGEYTLTFSPAGTEVPFKTLALTLDSRDSTTVILHGESDAGLTVTALDDDLGIPQSDRAHVAVFNALDGQDEVRLINLVSPLVDDWRQVIPVSEPVAYGTRSAAIPVDPSIAGSLAVIEGGSETAVLEGNFRPVLVRFNNIPGLSLARQQSFLYILTGQRALNGGLEPLLITREDPGALAYGDPAAVGMRLFTEYVLPVQLVALLLLAAMIGVIILTLRKDIEPKPSRLMRRKVSRPLTAVISTQTGSDLGPSVPQIEAPKSASGGQPEPAGD